MARWIISFISSSFDLRLSAPKSPSRFVSIVLSAGESGASGSVRSLTDFSSKMQYGGGLIGVR
jgi:hypothetical protein